MEINVVMSYKNRLVSGWVEANTFRFRLRIFYFEILLGSTTLCVYIVIAYNEFTVVHNVFPYQKCLYGFSSIVLLLYLRKLNFHGLETFR